MELFEALVARTRMTLPLFPLFLLSVRALNSHAGPLLDEYELVELDLPQPELPSLGDTIGTVHELRHSFTIDKLKFKLNIWIIDIYIRIFLRSQVYTISYFVSFQCLYFQMPSYFMGNPLELDFSPFRSRARRAAEEWRGVGTGAGQPRYREHGGPRAAARLSR